MAIEKIKILGAVLELPAKQHCQFSPFGPIFEVNGLYWQCYLAGSSKTAPKDFDFFNCHRCRLFIQDEKQWAPAFFKHIHSLIATVPCDLTKNIILPSMSSSSISFFWLEGSSWSNMSHLDVTAWACTSSGSTVSHLEGTKPEGSGFFWDLLPLPLGAGCCCCCWVGPGVAEFFSSNCNGTPSTSESSPESW